VTNSLRRSYDGVVMAAPVTVPYMRYSIESAQWWIGRALGALVAQAGIRASDIDGLCVSSFTMGTDSGIGLTQHFGLCVRWLDTIPLGGASAVAAVRKAARAVQARDADIVACVAGDTNHVDSFRLTLENFSRFNQDAVYPYGAGGANASFALIARNYMRTFGVKREDVGRIAVAQRANALRNPHALMKTPLTLEQYMAARPISDPIHLFDCVMPCAGAEAFLVMRDETAASLGLPAAQLLSTIERHNAFAEDTMQVRGGWAMDVDELYAMAGVKPDDLDIVQTYDDYPVITMMQFEDLGFCKKGEGAEFVRQHDLTIEGDFPHNTSGGQLSVGQAGAAGAYLGLVEGLRQVLGVAGPTQVANASVGLASGFGMINYDRGLASGAAIFAGPSRGLTRSNRPGARTRCCGRGFLRHRRGRAAGRRTGSRARPPKGASCFSAARPAALSPIRREKHAHSASRRASHSRTRLAVACCLPRRRRACRATSIFANGRPGASASSRWTAARRSSPISMPTASRVRRSACRFNSTRAVRRWPLPDPRGRRPTWQTTGSGGK